jgi:hypothetical protein
MDEATIDTPTPAPAEIPQKLNPWHTKRFERVAETRVFEKDGPPLTFIFRRPFAAEMSRALDTRTRLFELFVTGTKDQPAATFFDAIELSESLVMMAAMAEAMQPPDSPVQYTAEEFILWSDRRPNDWVDAVRWIRDLAGDWLGSGGK